MCKVGHRYCTMNNVFGSDYSLENAKIKNKNRVISWNAQCEWILHSNTTCSPIQKFDLPTVACLAKHTHFQLAWETSLGLLSFPVRNFYYGSEENISFIKPSSGGFFTWRLWQFRDDDNKVKMKTLYFISVGMLLTSGKRKLWLHWL